MSKPHPPWRGCAHRPLESVQIRAICTDCNSFLCPALSRKCCGSAGARRVSDAGGFPGLFTASTALALKWWNMRNILIQRWPRRGSKRCYFGFFISVGMELQPLFFPARCLGRIDGEGEICRRPSWCFQMLPKGQKKTYNKNNLYKNSCPASDLSSATFGSSIDKVRNKHHASSE